MSVTVTFNGTSYTIPSPGESAEWGTSLNVFLTALAGALGTAGGSITAATSVGLTLSGSATMCPVRIVGVASAPTGANAVGAMYMTTAGVLKVCTVAGSPGTFVSVGTQT